MFGAKAADGGCHVPLPQLGTAVDLWLDGNELRIGSKGAAAPSGRPALGGLGDELAAGEWSFVMYGHGTTLTVPAIPPVPDRNGVVGQLLRGMSMFSEMGLGVRVDNGTLRAVLGVRTAWANPDDVVAKLLAIPGADLAAGNAGPAAKAIAAAAPDSPFARDVRAGWAGVEVPAASVGMLAAIAVPAFMDYMKKSKRTEASLQLDKLGKNAKVYALTNAEFPAGDAGPTPAGPCCQGPGGRCAIDGSGWQQATWQALDFEIDEPNLFQYSYHSDGKTFTAQAVGDPGCSGASVTYKLEGKLDNGTPQLTLTGP
jgi:hypothetical protein